MASVPGTGTISKNVLSVEDVFKVENLSKKMWR